MDKIVEGEVIGGIVLVTMDALIGFRGAQGAEGARVIQVAPGTKVHLACRPVSMRYGFDGLAAQVANTLKADPYSGHLFLFRGKRGDYLKAPLLGRVGPVPVREAARAGEVRLAAPNWGSFAAR